MKLITHRKKSIAATCVFLFSSTVFFLAYYGDIRTPDLYIGQEELRTDDLDRHFISVNYALGNCFPMSGFLFPDSVYKITPDANKQDVTNASIFLKIMKDSGPVITFIRPPLYPLLIGLLYKALGINIAINHYVNILLLALISGSLPLLAILLWQKRGILIGIIAAVVFVVVDCDPVGIRGPNQEPFILFIMYSLFSFSLLLSHTSKNYLFVLWGCLFGLSYLTKPVTILMPFFLLAYIIYSDKGRSFSGFLRYSGLISVGFLIVVGPWLLFINKKLKSTFKERAEWVSRVKKSDTPVVFEKWGDLPNCETGNQELCLNVQKHLMHSLLVFHSDTRDSLQLVPGGVGVLLFENNEYSIDGRPHHYEWTMVKESFYNRSEIAHLPPLQRIIKFYLEYPTYLYKVPFARFIIASSSPPRFFLLCVYLWGIFNVYWILAANISPQKVKLLKIATVILASGSIFTLIYFENRFIYLLLIFPMILALLLSLRKQTYICDLNFIFIWSAVSSFATFFFCAGGLPGEFNPIFILYSAAYLVKIIQLMINQPKIPTSGLYQRV